jgi:hypothetical protein
MAVAAMDIFHPGIPTAGFRREEACWCRASVPEFEAQRRLQRRNDGHGDGSLIGCPPGEPRAGRGAGKDYLNCRDCG